MNDDRALQRALREWSDSMRPAKDRWEEILHEASERRRRPRTLVGVLAAAAAVVLIVIGATTIFHNNHEPTTKAAGPSTMTSSRDSAGPSTSTAAPTTTATTALSTYAKTGSGDSTYQDVAIAGSCMNPINPNAQYPQMVLNSLKYGSVWIVGEMQPTGRTILDNKDDGPVPVVLSEVKLRVDKVVAGIGTGLPTMAYVPGGIYDNRYRTTVNDSALAWGPDGMFFGEVYPSGYLAGKYEVSALPIVADRVAFPKIDCATAKGLKTARQDVNYQQLASGTVSQESATLDTIALSSLLSLIK